MSPWAAFMLKTKPEHALLRSMAPTAPAETVGHGARDGGRRAVGGHGGRHDQVEVGGREARIGEGGPGRFGREGGGRFTGFGVVDAGARGCPSAG